MIVNVKGLDFHQTFKPERDCLSTLLTELDSCSGTTVAEISKITGIPTGSSSGKVVPTIFYLEYMGLIQEQLDNKKYRLEYTTIGEAVLAEDPGLMEELSLMLLHCMIARKRNGAELWSYIICEVLSKYHGRINKINLEKELQMHFGKTVNLSPFNGSYSGLFEQLGIIKISNDEYVMQPHSFNPEYEYLYGLILYKYWDEWASEFSDEQKRNEKVSIIEITADQIEQTGFRRVFGWTEQIEYQALEALNDKGIVSLNRQMSPFAVRRILKEEEIIDLLYSELC